LDPGLKFSGSGSWFGLESNFLSVFHFHYISLMYFYSAQASGFSAPGAVGGLPEERGGAADEVATGSGTNSGSSATAPAQFHLGEVKFFWIHKVRQRGTSSLFIGVRYPSGTVD
jgi:hypothetical protein